ncbi:MAG: tetratricopeptide repeat protein [Phycisphaeraceae bacterium]|nr:tetratricopeptide repeat protein [Phycisphaeraceae bacterium]
MDLAGLKLNRPLRAAMLATAVFLLVNACFSPRFVMWRGLSLGIGYKLELSRAAETLRLIDDPFHYRPGPDNLPIRWRLLMPLVWHALSLPKGLFLAMPHLGGLLACFLVAAILLRRTGRAGLTFAATVCFAANDWFMVSMGWLTYFDSWTMLALVLIALRRSRVELALTCLLTPWIDERFLLFLPLALLLRSSCDDTMDVRAIWRSLARDAAIAGAAIAVYGVLRLLLMRHGMAGAGATYGQVLRNNLIAHPLSQRWPGVWYSLRAAWAFPLLLLARTWSCRPCWMFWLMLTLIALGVAMGLTTAGDISRTISLLALTVPVAVLQLRRPDAKYVRWSLAAILAAQLALPACHYVASFQIPVRTLAHEISQWRRSSTQDEVNYFMRQGLSLGDAGRWEQAEQAFAMALRLNPRHAPAWLHVGRIAQRQGRLPQALTRLNKAVELAPDQPDVWYARAGARFALGDRPGTIDDLQHALAVAPHQWPDRAACESALHKLTREPDAAPATAPSQTLPSLTLPPANLD